MRIYFGKRTEYGTKRYVKKFAFLPIITEDRIFVWLERYSSEEVFTKGIFKWKSIKKSIL